MNKYPRFEMNTELNVVSTVYYACPLLSNKFGQTVLVSRTN